MLSRSKSITYSKKLLSPDSPLWQTQTEIGSFMQTQHTTFVATGHTSIPSPRIAPRCAKIIYLPNLKKHEYIPRARHYYL
jgi:hypothetical protein